MEENLCPFESKIWLSSPTMHGPELEYIRKAAAVILDKPL